MHNGLPRHLQGLLLGGGKYLVIDMHRGAATEGYIHTVDTIAGKDPFHVGHRTRHETSPARLRHVPRAPSDCILVEVDAVELQILVGPPERLKIRAYTTSQLKHRFRSNGRAFGCEPVA